MAHTITPAQLFGTLMPDHGGTGQDLLERNGVLVGNGTAAVVVVPPGSSGTVLTANAPGTAPSWQAGGGEVTFPLVGTPNATIYGQESLTSSSGGQVILLGGDSLSGNPGGVTISGGFASSTDHIGGSITLQGGGVSLYGQGGGIVLVGADGAATGGGGGITLHAGDAGEGAGNHAGTILITAGSVFGTTGVVGDVQIVAGAAGNNPTGRGGKCYLVGGDALSGVGGAVYIVGGDSTSGDGGKIVIRPGTAGGGTQGFVIMDHLPTSDPSVAGALWASGAGHNLVVSQG